jgi:membrane associated rhomboid family serine protease
VRAGASGITGGLAVHIYQHRDQLGQRGHVMFKCVTFLCSQRDAIISLKRGLTRVVCCCSHLKKVVVMNLLFGMMMPRIDNWGHVGGLVGGSIASFAFAPGKVRALAP